MMSSRKQGISRLMCWASAMLTATIILGGLLTHEKHVDLVRHEAQLTSNREQHKSKFTNLGHAEAHREGSLRWEPEHVHYATNLQHATAYAQFPSICIPDSSCISMACNNLHTSQSMHCSSF